MKGATYTMGAVREIDGQKGREGWLLGCAVETYPIKWRLNAAIQRLENDDVEDCMAMLMDINREIRVAEMLRRPVPMISMMEVA